MKKLLLIAATLLFYVNTQAQFGWVKSVGGSDKDHVNGLAYDNAGHVYLTGHISDNADMDPSTGNYPLTYGSAFNDAEMFVAKYDTNGTIIWAINTPGANSNSNGTNIVYDPAGNIYVLAEAGGGASSIGLVDWDPGSGVVTVPHNWNTYDVVLAKYDTSGNLVWVQLIVTKSTLSNVCYPNGLALDNAGNVYVTGQYSLTVDMDPSASTFNLTSTGGRDIYFAKYSSAGALLWAHSIGGSGDDEGQGIYITPSNQVFLYGHFQGISVDFDVKSGIDTMTAASPNAFYAEYDTAANLQLVNKIDGYSDYNDLTVDASGNIIAAGWFNGTADIDPSANTVNITSGVSGSSYDHFLVKYDNAGVFQFGYGFPSSTVALQEEGELLTDASDNIYFGGDFTGTIDYSGGSSTGILTSASIDFVIAKYSPAGVLDYAYNAGSAIEQMREFVLLNNSLFIVGDVRGNSNFDPCGGTANAGSPEYDIFMLKMDIGGCNLTTDISDNPLTKKNLIYPNPNEKGELNISSKGKYEVSIFNINGQLIKTISNQNDNSTIDISELKQGIYFVQIVGEVNNATQKLIVR